MTISDDDVVRLDDLIGLIAIGPKLSKDLSREQARDGMRHVLIGRAHPVPVPADLGAADRQERARVTAQMGLAALNGEPGPFLDGLLYSAALCLWLLGREPDPLAAAGRVRRALEGGEALARLEAARG